LANEKADYASSAFIFAARFAEVAELVDAHDSNSCAARRAGSIPAFGTKQALNAD
jgi:hypothetical protein